MKRKQIQLLGLFTAFILLNSGMSMAQLKQGTVLAGGRFNVSFGTIKNESPGSNQNTTIVTTTRYSDVTFNPKMGLFITDALALGVDFNIDTYTSKNKDNGVRSTSSYYTLGAFGRYYFPSKIFLESGLGFGRKSTNGNSMTNLFTYSLGAGYAIFFNKNVALEPMILYKGMKDTNVKDSRYKTSNGSLQVGLGLQVYF
jgi:hypothetical protein